MIVQALLFCLFLPAGRVATPTQDTVKTDPFPVYAVKRLAGAIVIDGNWNKAAWATIKPALITYDIINVPAFHPTTEVKMVYDTGNLYVIFLVHDRYVRSLTTKVNGPVWKDAAVEFFFCTDTTRPDRYFNLEINCGGTLLLGYNAVLLMMDDIRSIEVAHSMPAVVDPEAAGPVDWTIEYRIPLAMLAKYGRMTRPARGVRWRANFCKIAENSSNPHHMTWSPIEGPQPTFHMPQYFGRLDFE